MVKEYKDLIEDERARSGLEVEEILATVKDPHLLKSCVVKCVDDGDDEVYVRFNRWVYPEFAERLEDLRVGKDALIVKGIKREGFGTSIQAREIWAVELDD
jgi:Zierdtviridae DNA polymerase